MNDLLTVLIPTSPIPSHPSTAILDETISNIRKYTDARIIIMFDGIHQSMEHRRHDYDQYYQQVQAKKESYGHCDIIPFTTHCHQSMMTKYVISNMVKTPLVLFCEHDTSPIGDIPLRLICDFVQQSGTINCVRFNIFHEIPMEHKYLMLDREPQMYYQAVHDGIASQPVMLTRTIQWSQRPHIAKTLWYHKILHTHFQATPKGMIEDVMHSVVQTAFHASGQDYFGLAIYTPEGNQLRSYHSDGRGSDEKIIGS